MRSRARLHRCSSSAGSIILAIAAAGSALAGPAGSAFAAERGGHADLRADVNRDGRIDVTGDSDNSGEDSWSVERGAVYLPNIDDDAERCPITGAGSRPLSATELAACNDGFDTKVNGIEDEADLARVRSVPLPGLAADSNGRLEIVTGGEHTHLFLKRAGQWIPVRPDTHLTAAELRLGVEMGIEATDIIRDNAKWDGRAVIQLTVTSGQESTSDAVTLRAAPLLTHHHLQNTQQVMVSKVPGEDANSRLQQQFVTDLEQHVKNAGITTPLVIFDKYGDRWAQDFVEPAFVSMTGPNGKRQVIRVMLSFAQRDRDAGRELFEKLRGRDVGVIHVTDREGPAAWSLNSMGNLETIPPYTHDGHSFPAGRIIMGERTDSGARPSKVMRTLLTSQGMQDPLLLDVSWLDVGHVDEFVQFLPADTPRGWRIGISDPEAGLQLLRKAKHHGHGQTKMFSHPGSSDSPASKETIDRALASRHLVADNEMAARQIAANLEILKRETGITDAEIVRVPALYTRTPQTHTTKNQEPSVPRLTRMGAGTDPVNSREGHGQHERRTENPTTPLTAREAAVMTGSYIPGAVNGLVLTRDHYLAPHQWGPVIDGRDIFTQAVTTAYQQAGLKVSYIDDWYTYHLGRGEVHCGTNTLRDTTAAWWQRPAAPRGL
ncbi:protein-arginine deiminase domain-containing protein [Streptomyces sp. MS2.AVA.5]|uniref:Protein-arginine deiminase domain-containing protein n=1 Tax=Streptomyces achmelvichensis TaxID=3134111 RepID=A0ACC6PM94_9ACTN